MRLVIDASVVVQMLLADARLGPLAGHQLRAPALLPSEVTSVLRELVWRAEVPEPTAQHALTELVALPIELERPGGLAIEATAIAAELGWAKTYDAEYLALARRLACPLVTLDQRLGRGVAGRFDVRLPHEL